MLRDDDRAPGKPGGCVGGQVGQVETIVQMHHVGLAYRARHAPERPRRPDREWKTEATLDGVPAALRDTAQLRRVGRRVATARGPLDTHPAVADEARGEQARHALDASEMRGKVR